MEKFQAIVIFLIKAFMLAVFLPVLFCVLFIGNHMDYYEGNKLTTLLPNPVLAVIACIGIIVCMILFLKFSRELSGRANWLINGILIVLFVALYFVNVRITREIAFPIPWDIGVVKVMAHKIGEEQMIGYEYYLSMYSNNIPISYILGRIYRKAMEFANYPYILDFVWMQVNCALISLGGFFCCLTVKKLTRRVMPVVITFFLYVILVGLSPWKMAPYTDTFGLIFPILSIYFYICYREAEKIWLKYLFIILAFVSGATGGFIKPSIYLILIGILGVEFLFFLAEWRKEWKFLLVEVLLLFLLAGGLRTYKYQIIEEIGLDFNEEIEMSWQHYFMMGLNEDTTGGYSQEDAGLIGKYQTSKSERIEAEMDIAFSRIREKGFFGSLYFWLRKMTMVFNDGTFGWRGEVWITEYYPETLASGSALTEYLRNIFWNGGSDMGRYNTLCQLVLIFCIMGIPGVCFFPKEERERYVILMVGFLGIFFYQLLLESRARYLFVFLPVLITISICGMQCYARYAAILWKKRKSSKERTE